MNKVNFHTARTFYQSSMRGAASGWYFTARNGRTIGPFLSHAEMQLALHSFVKACVTTGDYSGRHSRHHSAA